MNRQKSFWLKALLFFQLISLSGVAGVIRFHQRLQDSVSTTGKDTLTTEVTPKTGNFKDASVSDILTVGIDPSYVKYLTDSSAYVVTLSINGYNASNALISTLSHSFKITHNPTGKGALRDQDLFLFKNAYKYRIQVTGITKNGVAVTNLPDYIYIDADIEINRYYAFSANAATPMSVNPSTALNIDCDINNIYDELDISWTGCFGGICPESYDLEWTFINDYDVTIGSFKSASSISYDFRGNSTRVNTTDGHYRISLLYEHGYILYRVRGIGVDTANPAIPIVGVWSLADSASVSSGMSSGTYYHVVQPHESDNKNWQYNASFAEEAKKKEIMAYYDGSQRTRQSVTKMNSDKNTLVGETFYDFQGRPAINALPAPVDFPTCNDTSEPAIKFYPNFNQNETGQGYSRTDFDVDASSGACNVAVGDMSTISGASHYYSPANPNKTAQQAFLPDAKKYPFTQVEYTSDNTGRISRQGGVGIDFQLNKGHEMKYFYGQPDQLHLNRMFGSEAGDALHYKENVTIDQNGQSSISYMNMEGKTVATSLAGDSVPGLAKLPSNTAPVTLTVDMFNKNANGVSNINTVNTTGNGIEFNTQLLVPYTSTYNFSYSFSVDTMGDACLRDSICFSCIYDLEMHLYDDCGTDLFAIGKPLVKTVGHFSYSNSSDSTLLDSTLIFTVNCNSSNITFEKDTFPLFLTAGNYSMSKILTVNQQAVNYYTKQYLDSANNFCFKTLDSFLDSAMSNVDTSNCHVTCATCVQKLGDRDAYVATGKGTYLQYDALYDACTEPCKPKSQCYISYTQMLADMSPDGQYGQYQDSIAGQADINASIYPLSVFNDNNVLPRNNGTGNGNWRHPYLILNNTVYNHYADDNGNIATINLHDSAGIYLPLVSSGTTVLFDTATNTYYTYPENLANFKDFLGHWYSSWSNSLVYYHPEYDYYLNCSAFGVQQTGETTTSDAFDAMMQHTTKFVDAVANGLIKTNYLSLPYAQRITDFTQVSTGHPYDPFLLHYGVYSAQLAAALNNYQPNYTDTSTLTMAEMAAYVVRCGNLFGSNSHLGCIAFGDTVGGIRDSVLNNEWQIFVGFYMSLKQKLQKEYLDSITKKGPGLTNYGYNGCFSDSNSTYNGYASLGSQWFSQYQPCGYNTYTYYINKIPRFGNAPLPSSINAIQYENYLATGQCPIANNLQNLLNQFAGSGKIKSAHLQPLRNYPVFAPDLYVALGGDTTKSYQNFYWNSFTLGDSLNMNFTDSVGDTTCSLVINLSTAGITNLGKYHIMAVSGLSDTTYANFPNAFRVFLALQDTTISPPQVVYKLALGHSSCFDIDNCKFQQSCQPSDFAIALQNLMNILAINGDIFSSYVDLGQTKYQPYVTLQLKNQLGQTTSDSLVWTYATTPAGPGGNPPAKTTFSLYDNLGTGNVQLIISGNIPNQGNVQGFSHINSDYYNNFTITAIDSTDGDTSLSGYAQSGANAIGVSMGTCGYPTSFACQGTQFQLQNDLQLLVHDALTSIGSNAATDTSSNPITFSADSFSVNLTKLPSYSILLANAFPHGMDTTSSVVNYHTSGFGGKYTTELLFTVKSALDSCYFSLYADSAYGFRHIIDFYGLQAMGPADPNNNYHEFKGIVKYTQGTSTIVDTVYGKSCLGIQTCCACGTDTISNHYSYSGTSGDTVIASPSPCQGAYNQYIAALNNYTAHMQPNDNPISFMPLTLQQMVNGGYCSCVPNYVAYVNSAQTDSLSKPFILENINSFKCYQADTCQALYNAYVSAVAPLKGNAIPYSVILAGGFCSCIPNYIAYLNAWVADSSNENQGDLLSITKFNCYNSETCGRNYYTYVTAMHNYLCNGACANGFLDSTTDLSSYIQSYDQILAQNKCACIDPYVEYLQTLPAYTYSVDSTTGNINYPAFEGILSFNCAVADTCNLTVYNQYVNTLSAYLCNGPCRTGYLDSTNFSQYILPYSNIIESGLCSCLNPYISYIQAQPPYVLTTTNDTIYGIARDGNDTMYISQQIVNPPITFILDYNCPVDTAVNATECKAALGLCLVAIRNYTDHYYVPYSLEVSTQYLQSNNYCACLASYAAYLNNFQSEITIGPMKYNLYPVPITEFNCSPVTDSCAAQYAQYTNVLTTYCTTHNCGADSAQITSHLNSLVLPYDSVYSSGLCGCLSNYINYMDTVTVLKYTPQRVFIGISYPASLLSYNCSGNSNNGSGNSGGSGPGGDSGGDSGGSGGSGTTPTNTLSSACQQNYSNYLTAVNNYNAVYGPGGSNHQTQPVYQHLPAINITYTENEFTEHGLCYCVPSYDAYLTALVNASIAPNQIDTSMLNIFQYCDYNYHPPCKTYVTPDTGNGGGDGFPQDSMSYPPPDNSCAQYQVNLAVENGTNAYNQYYDSLTSIIAAKYMKHCLGAVENLTDRFKDKEFHYTLYYYDQGGNLIRTVPPEGVHLVNMTASPNTPFSTPTNAADSICYDQTYDTHLFYTSHTMPTTYLYNTLNQLVKQSLPDHDPIEIWQYALPNGLDSRLNVTGVQFVNNNAGYLTGYITLPTPILPGITKRGYIYTTSDAGMSWTPMPGLVSGNFNKVQMVTPYTGYAVGNQGMFMKTQDGGQSWDIIPSFGWYTGGWKFAPDWNDVFFKDSLHGILVGSKGKSMLIDFTQSGPSNYADTVSLPKSAADALTGITYDGSNAYASAIAADGTGRLWHSIGDPFGSGALNWRIVTGTPSDNLLGIQFLNATPATNLNKGFISGVNGTLIKTSDGGVSWTTIKSGVSNNIEDIYFRNDSVGVAIIDSSAGAWQIYKTATGGTSWNLLGQRGQYYTSMAFYPCSNASTADKAFAAGKSGILSRIIASTSSSAPYYAAGTSYFGVNNLNSPNTHVDYNAVAAATYTVSGTARPKVVLGASNGKAYFSANADSSYLVWDSVTVSPNPLMKAAVLLNTGSSNAIQAAAIDNAGTIYGIDAASHNVSAVSGTHHFSDVSVQGSKFYAFDNTNKQVYSLAFSTGSSPALSATPLNSNTAINNGKAIGFIGTSLVVAGDSGDIYKDSLVAATSGSPQWIDYSTSLKFAAMNDVQADGNTGSQAVYAVGDNGTLLLKKPADTTWKKISIPYHTNLNAIKFYNGINGVTAGDGAKMYAVTTDALYNVSLSAITTSPAGLSGNLNDVIINSNKAAYAVGDGALAIGITDVTTTLPLSATKLSLGSNTGNLRGAAIWPDGTLLAAGGTNNLYNVTPLYIQNITTIFPPAIKKAHFASLQDGYLIGDNGFIRHTTDAVNWQTVLPDLTHNSLDTFNNVYTYQNDKAIIIGQNGYLSTINNNISPVRINTSTALGGTPDLYDIGFGGNSPTAGYIVGANQTAFKFTLPLSITTLGTLPTIGSGYDLHAVYVFFDNSIMAVGSNAASVFYNAQNHNWYEHDAPVPYNSTGTTHANYNDVYFSDDQNGYVVGDKGVALRWSSPLNIQQINHPTLPSQSMFAPRPTRDIYGATDSTKFNITSIAFSGNNNGFMGGYYPDSLSNALYARYLTDESLDFSTFFWYDQLGRMVASQNSRQYAKSPHAYSYTLYDALGRITEVGEKPENSSGLQFSNLFTGQAGSGNVLSNAPTTGQVDYTKLVTWAAQQGIRHEVTKTFYDTVVFNQPPIVQQNLRKRVADAAYYDTLHVTDSLNTYNHATHFSYDQHGNISTLLQDNPTLASLKQQYKRVDYDYDLISGKVNDVYYEKDSLDQFTHKYNYDADNRLTDVYTSRDGLIWDHDAKYFYYAHGPLARVEYGTNHVQGLDYAYTLQGWIKGMNSEALVPSHDIGKDGLNTTGNPNKHFARDAFGYSLTYFKNDYAAIDPAWTNDSANNFLASQYFDPSDPVPSDLIGYRSDLYNGNIVSMVSSVTNPQLKTAMPLGSTYRYDQLNRLIQSASFNEMIPVRNVWNNENGYYPWETFAYLNKFSYDANGNIQSQLRQDMNGITFDSLTYHYNMQNGNLVQNRLYLVNDTIPASVMNDDIDNQGVFNPNSFYMNSKNNYSYDPIGNLVKDSAEGIAKIDWTVYGKIKSITHRSGYMRIAGNDTTYPPDLVFNYDAAGNRISKVIKPRNTTGVKANTYWATEYYVRDAQGNILSTYKQRDSSEISKLYFTQTELPVYGSSRLGIDETQTQLLGLTASADTSHHYSGYKLYEMSNHLGNVLTTISDRKIPVNPQSPVFIYSTPDVVRTSIDSLGGMKIQPMQQFAGNHFTIPATIGNNYKVDFYLNLANTNPDSVTGDWSVISYDANNVNGYSYNWLDHTGHYSFTLNAPDTLFDFKILYYNQGSAPYHYMLFDSLQITEVGNTNDTIVAYTSDIRSVSDVSGFGAPLAGRTWSAGADPNSFNGKRKDNEIFGTGNSYDFGERQYDPRLGKFMSIDPITKRYPWQSPFAFVRNNPVFFVDVEGEGDPLEKMEIRDNRASNLQGHVRNGGARVHQGFDLKAEPGTPVLAVKNAVVFSVVHDLKADYGNQITLKITDEDGTVRYAQYSHLSCMNVNKGDKVTEGQIIGETGMTGNASNLPKDQAHLHFEYRTAPNPGLGLGGRLSPNDILDTKFYTQNAKGNQGQTGVYKVDKDGTVTKESVKGTKTTVYVPPPPSFDSSLEGAPNK